MGADSVMLLEVVRRNGGSRTDSVTLRFPEGVSVAESAPLPPGVYDVTYRGGRAVLAVNHSREWLPRPPNVESGAIGDARMAKPAAR